MKLSRERDVEFSKDLKRFVPPRLFLMNVFGGELDVLIGRENRRQKSGLIIFFSHSSLINCMTCSKQGISQLFLFVFMNKIRETAVAYVTTGEA